MKYPVVRNYIGGAFATAELPEVDVFDPSADVVISRVPMSGVRELDAAVAAARQAFPSWAATPIKQRVQVFFRYKALLERHIDGLAALITEENGKIASEARAEIDKAAELCEFACSLPQVATGEVLEVSRGVECRVERFPLGIVAGITPFNFPTMVPHWSFPNAIALGNCFILKPSEMVPLSAGRTAELLAEAGLPPGVFQVVHGGKDVVEAICDHPGIRAVSFVGSTKTAKAVYRRATSNLKRCLALGGAKNHVIVMPDADREMAAENIVASMSGCAGQRCMAASVMVAVSATDHVIGRMAELAKAMVPGKDIGPVISAEARARIVSCIDEAERQGAQVIVDGRNVRVPGCENGYFLGPTIVDRVRPGMRIVEEEVFGPVLVIIRARDVDEAIAVENASPYGNAASVYTESGGVARKVMEQAHAGMVGVNVGVPVPREPFSFGGWNESRFGVGDITGRGSIEFWTQSKKMTTKWNRETGDGRRETGDGRQETGDGRQETGDRRRETAIRTHAEDTSMTATEPMLSMPACNHRPRTYAGPSKAEVLAMRQQYTNPAVFTIYKDPLMIVEGYLQYLWDETGRRYLDCLAGIVTVGIGHAHPKYVKRVTEQVATLSHATTIYLHPNFPMLARKLASKMPKGLDVTYFTNSGTEANELAIAMARLHTGASDVITLRHAYHGNSATAMGLTGMHTWKYALESGGRIHHAINPDPYRSPFTGTPEEVASKAADDVRDIIRTATPGKIAAFLCEPIQGAGGVTHGAPNYLKEVYAHVRAAGGLCIADEVQTGFGRTGEHYWGFQNFGVVPDFVTMAKSLGNGAPIGAVTTRMDIARTLAGRTHFNTFGGNPVSMAAGLAVLDIIDEEGLQANCKARGAQFRAGLAKMQKSYPIIGDVRGMGLMIGVELVTDRATREPAKAAAIEMLEATKEMGLLIAKGGMDGNVMRVKPPMCITAADVDFALDVLDRSFAAVS